MSRPTRMPPPTSQVRRMKPCRDGRSFAAHDHGDAEFESEEAGGVVDEAFAFEDVDDALREAEIFGDGGGGDGVGGGDDGAEDDAEAKIEWSEGVVCGFGDSPNGEADETEGEKEDADDVVFEVAPTGEPCGGVEQRRKNDEEDDVGADGDVRDAGDEAEDESGDDEDDGVGDLDFTGEGGEDDDEEEQEKKDEFDGVDAVSCIPGPCEIRPW